MVTEPIASLVDKLLAAPKTLAGTPEWEDSTRDRYDEKCLKWPLRIGGLPCNATLEANAYPSYGNSKNRWRIKILFPQCIWRIDYTHDENHVNSFNKPSDLHEHNINGPHYHSWEDNKRFCTHSSLPQDLQNARMLPANIQTFDNALRWFCNHTNIELPHAHMLELPRRERLL